MGTEEINLSLVKHARELQEFFVGTYADYALEDAIKSGNNDLLKLAVREYASARQLIEEHEEQ